jgi:hypothetical protein
MNGSLAMRSGADANYAWTAVTCKPLNQRDRRPSPGDNVAFPRKEQAGMNSIPATATVMPIGKNPCAP